MYQERVDLLFSSFQMQLVSTSSKWEGSVRQGRKWCSRIYSSQCLYMENAVSGIHFSTLWSKKLPSQFSVMGYLSYIRISKKVCRCFDYSVHPPHYSVQVILCTLRRILLRHSHTSSLGSSWIVLTTPRFWKCEYGIRIQVIAQLTLICLKSEIETLGNGVKCVQS